MSRDLTETGVNLNNLMNEVKENLDGGEVKIEEQVKEVNPPKENPVKEGPVASKEEVKEEKPAEKSEKVADEYWTKLNPLLGRNEENSFTSEEDVKTFFEELNGRAGKASDYEKEMDVLKSRGDEYNALMKHIQDNEGTYDPKNSMFGGDEDAMKRHFISTELEKNGLNKSVIDRVLDPNIDNMDALDVITIGRQLNSKRLTGKDQLVKEAILKEIGVDIEDGQSIKEAYKNLSGTQQTQLEMEADKIVNEIKKTVNSVEIPEVADPIKKILEDHKSHKENVTKLAEDWKSNETSEKLNAKLETVKFSHEGFDFEYKMSDGEKESLIKEIVVDAAIRGKELNEDNIAAMSQLAIQRFAGKNMGKLFSAASKQFEMKSKETIEKEVFNGKKSDMQKEKTEQSPTTHPFETGMNKVFSGKDVRNL